MHILAYSDIFKHNQKYSQAHSKHSIILAYLESWHIQCQKHIQSRAIFRTLTYSEPWYIQSPGIFRTLFYSEAWYSQNPDIFRTLLNIYDGAFSRKQLTAIIIFITSACQVLYFMKKNMIFLIIFMPKVFTQCKVQDPRKPRAGGSEFLIHLFVDVCK